MTSCFQFSSSARSESKGIVSLASGSATLFILFATVLIARADDTSAPVPILRVDPGGHCSYVTSLAWEPDGHRLYSAGWDKIVRVWKRNANGAFVNAPEEAVRVPISVGRSGQIDCVTISDDGRWMAIGGYASLIQRAASFHEAGVEIPISSKELAEQGVIYLLDRTNNTFRRLVGHLGPVSRLLFVSDPDGSVYLVSAGFDVKSMESQEKTQSIRVWNVDSAKYVSGIVFPLPDRQVRPSLVAFPSSSTSQGFELLAAWGNEKLYQLNSRKLPSIEHTYPDGMFNNRIVVGPGAKWILTSSADNRTNEGRISFWNVNAGGALQHDTRQSITYRAAGNEIFLPVGLALLQTGEQPPMGHVAVAVCVLRRNQSGRFVPDRVQLRIHPVAARPADGREPPVITRDLWTLDASDVPDVELAYSAKARSLAVAGNPNHEIWLYDVPRLLDGQAQPQKLGGQMSIAQQIEFVESSGHLGLKFSSKPKTTGRAQHGEAASHVFDLTESSIDHVKASTWKSNRSSLGQAWSAKPSPGNPRQLDITNTANQVNYSVRAPREHKVTDFLFTTPLARTEAPLLLVAAQEGIQPWLGVFDARDGSLLRILQAHTMPINGMAVSGDSRLLATTSDDSTVGIWNLADVDALLQPRSMIPGLVLVPESEPIEVESVQESVVDASFKRGDFAKGDRLLGFVDPIQPGALRPWRSVEEFYASLLTFPANTNLTIQRQRGQQLSEIPVVLQQAVDERKPLIQLMISEPDHQGSRHWIGWDMLGHFDASSREVQQQLGWQFNVPRPDSPVAFATIEQYPEYRRSGLIGQAISSVDRPPVVAPLPVPRMTIVVLQPEIDSWNKQGVSIVRVAPEAVSLRITADDFPSSAIRAIKLALDGQVVDEFVPGGDAQWHTEQLKLAAWTRGLHRLQAILETRDTPSRTFSVDQELEFVPASPTISRIEIPPISTRESSVTFSAQVEAGSPIEPCDVSLIRIFDDGNSDIARRSEIVRTWSTEASEDSTLNIEMSLELTEGENNRFVLEARNRGASEATRELEAVSRQFGVLRMSRDDNPPTIEIKSIRVATFVSPSDISTLLPRSNDSANNNSANNDSASNDSASNDSASNTVEFAVGSETVTLIGSIRAAENLAVATINDLPLDGFSPDTAKELDFEIPLNLKAGLNTYLLAAKTDLSDTAHAALNIRFRQETPEIDVVEPAASQVFESLVPNAKVAFQAIFEPNAGMRPLSISVIVNGQTVTELPNADLVTGTIQGEIPVRVGSNTLHLRYSNDTGAEGQTTPVTFHYHPAPTIVRSSVPSEIDMSYYPVEVEGRSATQIQRVLLDNHELPPSDWTARQNGQQFTLQIPRVPWQDSRSQTTLAIYCSDVPRPTVEVIAVPKRTRPASPPYLQFVDFDGEASVNAETIPLAYWVHSRHELTSVTLTHNGRVIHQPDSPSPESGQDVHLTDRIAVHLTPGVNTFQLAAENLDGLKVEILRINYVPSPVSIHLDAVTLDDGSNILLPLVVEFDGSLRLPDAVDSHRIKLIGRVKWNYRDEEALADPNLKAWVSVNGFKRPVRLEPAVDQSSERAFISPLNLFGATKNSIEVFVPDLPQVLSANASLTIDCKSSQRRPQRLHLVVVGVGVESSEADNLRDAAIASVEGTFSPQDAQGKTFYFSSPAFSECIGYGPYTGALVSSEKIGHVLARIQVQANASDGDVMMLYYRGGEQVYEGDRFFLTTRVAQSEEIASTLRNAEQLRNRALSSDSLNGFVDYCSGCQVFLLDVVRATPTDAAMPLASNVIRKAALFRYAWLNADTDAPDDARLMSAWRSSTEARRLAQIAEGLQQQHEKLKKEFENAISYEYHLPFAMRNLVVRPEK